MDVLLVEDEAPLADVIARNLRARGHAVSIAATADAALDILALGEIEIIILDINLPDATGWEVLRRQSDEQRRRLRVVVISAAPVSTKRIDEFKPERILLKPFPMGALIRCINESAAPAGPDAMVSVPADDERSEIS
jgi:DNA-binding response OmpR family regulator